jgi:hypothetical protein
MAPSLAGASAKSSNYKERIRYLTKRQHCNTAISDALSKEVHSQHSHGAKDPTHRLQIQTTICK